MMRFRSRIFLFIAAFSIPASSSSVSGQELSIDRIFNFNDIYHFVGKPYPSPEFGEMRVISQTFTSRCGNLNRIILPLYFGDVRPELEFELYELNPEPKKIMERVIQTRNLSQPVQVARQTIKAALHSIWFQPLVDSRNKKYYWELTMRKSSEQTGTGLYLTSAQSPQLSPVRIDGNPRPDFAAFYTYCHYSFELDEIVDSTLFRLKREKAFLFFYAILLMAVVFFLLRAGKQTFVNQVMRK